MNYVLLALKFLPELISFLKFLEKKISEGIEEAQVRRDVKNVLEAFNNPNRQQAAQQLNDLFRKPK